MIVAGTIDISNNVYFHPSNIASEMKISFWIRIAVGGGTEYFS
jgi:hypothetical protein